MFEERIGELMERHGERNGEEEDKAKGKKKANIREAEINAMKERMNNDVEKEGQKLKQLAVAKNTTGYRRAWSSIVEKRIMGHHGIDK